MLKYYHSLNKTCSTKKYWFKIKCTGFNITRAQYCKTNKWATIAKHPYQGFVKIGCSLSPSEQNWQRSVSSKILQTQMGWYWGIHPKCFDRDLDRQNAPRIIREWPQNVQIIHFQCNQTNYIRTEVISRKFKN